ARDIVSIEPMAYDEITVVGDIKPRIKTVVNYGDGSWEVLTSGLSYEYDSSAMTIDENGIVTLKKNGAHKVTIKLEDKTTELTIKCG
ncbi:MAG: hypothetical protein IKU19_09015, partial [Clostridia bacterium]|nr:hypothetical protein [Clostridia bacterium]